MSLSPSYIPNYFSVSDILASEERILCKTEVTLPRLGFLDVSSEAEDLKAGTKLEFPFWLADVMHNRKGAPIVSIEIPKYYKEGYREILEADACAVTLSRWNQHFYELGMLLTRFTIAGTEKIPESLEKTFRCRIRQVMDWAQNPVADPTIGSQLPILERNLYLTGRKARLLLTGWLKEGVGSIETSEVVANYMKKRKRAEFEST